MPNPLVRIGTPNQSKGEPEGIAPEPENYEYESPNIPYRGGIDHGVKSDNKTEPPGGYDPAYIQDYALEAAEPTPVPVRIVQSGAREIKAWRVVRAYVGTDPVLVSDQIDEQTKVTLHNMSADTVVYVGDSRDNANVMFGFPLGVGAELTLNTSRAVYASAETDGTNLSILREYVIVEN